MPRTRHLAPSLAVGLSLMALAVVPALAQGEAAPSIGSSVPSDPVFTALLVDGTTASGQVRRLGEKDGVTLVSEQGGEQIVPPDRLVKLTREGASPPSNIEGGISSSSPTATGSPAARSARPASSTSASTPSRSKMSRSRSTASSG